MKGCTTRGTGPDLTCRVLALHQHATDVPSALQQRADDLSPHPRPAPASRDAWDEAPVDHWDHLWDDQLTWKDRRPVKRSLTRVVVELTLTVPVTGAVTAPAFGSANDPTNPGAGTSSDRGSTVSNSSHCVPYL